MAYAGVPPLTTDLTTGDLIAYKEAKDQDREFMAGLVQFAVFWLLNGRRYEGQPLINLSDIDPASFMEYLKREKEREQNKEADKPKLTPDQIRERNKKIDLQMRKKFFQRQVKK